MLCCAHLCDSRGSTAGVACSTTYLKHSNAMRATISMSFSPCRSLRLPTLWLCLCKCHRHLDVAFHVYSFCVHFVSIPCPFCVQPDVHSEFRTAASTWASSHQSTPADGCLHCIQLMEKVTVAVVAPVGSTQPLQVPVTPISYQALAQPVLMLQVWRAQVLSCLSCCYCGRLFCHYCCMLA